MQDQFYKDDEEDNDLKEYNALSDEDKESSIPASPSLISSIMSKNTPAPLVTPNVSPVMSSNIQVPAPNPNLDYLTALRDQYRASLEKAEKAKDTRKQIDLVSGMSEAGKQIGQAIAGVKYQEPEKLSVVQQAAKEEELLASKEAEQAGKGVLYGQRIQQKGMADAARLAEQQKAREKHVVGSDAAKDYFEKNKDVLMAHGVKSPEGMSLDQLEKLYNERLKIVGTGQSYDINKAKEQERAYAYKQQDKQKEREYKESHPRPLPEKQIEFFSKKKGVIQDIKDAKLLAQELSRGGEPFAFNGLDNFLKNARQKIAGFGEDLTPKEKALVELESNLSKLYSEQKKDWTGVTASKEEVELYKSVLPDLKGATSFNKIYSLLDKLERGHSNEFKNKVNFLDRNKYDMSSYYSVDKNKKEFYPDLDYDPSNNPVYQELAQYNEKFAKKSKTKFPLNKNQNIPAQQFQVPAVNNKAPVSTPATPITGQNTSKPTENAHGIPGAVFIAKNPNPTQ